MEKLGVNAGLLLTQIINFLIMAGVLSWLLYKPILKMLDERKRKIEEGLKLTEELKKEKEEYTEVKKRIVKEAKDEGQRMVKEAIEEAKRKNELLLIEGRQTLEKQKKKMLDEIKAEQEKMLGLARQKAADFAVQISEQILEKKIDEKEHYRLVAGALGRLKSLD